MTSQIIHYRRLRGLAFVCFGLGALVLVQSQSQGQGQGGGAKIEYRITYRDAEGKIDEVFGEIKETAKAVEWSNPTTKNSGSISPMQIVAVEPKSLPGLTLTELNPAKTQEETAPEKSAETYANLLKKVGPGGNEQTRRFLIYKEAMMSAKALNAKPLAVFDAEAPKIAEKLTAAARTCAKSWEVWPLSLSASRLYAEIGDFAKASSALRTLTSSPELSPQQKQELNLLEAAVALRLRNAPAARTLLDALASDASFPKAGPLQEQFKVMQAAAKLTIPLTPSQAPFPAAEAKPLQAAIDAATDPAARAIGHLVLGDLYAGHSLPRDAMWMYLSVDVVYNTKPEDQILAVRRLIPIFRLLGDDEKAERYEAKLSAVR